MCNYWHGGTTECRGDGFMWDADDDGYDPTDRSMPCPACNTAAYLAQAKTTAEETAYMYTYAGVMSGEDIWLGAISVALAASPFLTPKLLRRIGVVRPIIEHPTDRASWIEKCYDQRNSRYLVSRRTREFSKQNRPLTTRAEKSAIAAKRAMRKRRSK